LVIIFLTDTGTVKKVDCDGVLATTPKPVIGASIDCNLLPFGLGRHPSAIPDSNRVECTTPLVATAMRPRVAQERCAPLLHDVEINFTMIAEQFVTQAERSSLMQASNRPPTRIVQPKISMGIDTVYPAFT